MARKVFLQYSQFALSEGVLGFNGVFRHRHYLIISFLIQLPLYLHYQDHSNSFLVSVAQECVQFMFINIFRTYLAVSIDNRKTLKKCVFYDKRIEVCGEVMALQPSIQLNHFGHKDRKGFLFQQMHSRDSRNPGRDNALSIAVKW